MMYQFRRSDNDEVIEVDFPLMMTMDAAGFITLPDGVTARRINRPSVKRATEPATARQMAIVSDALGFTKHQLAEFEADRQAHGFKGVEFRPDPKEPSFIQAHFHSRKEHQRYMAHRGMVDKNSRNGSGAMLSQSMLDKLRQRLAAT